MSITFKKEFKNAILSGEKVATIRNSKHYNTGTVFKLNLGTRFKPEFIGEARCTCVAEISVKRLLEALIYCIEKIERNSLTTFSIHVTPFLTINLKPEYLGFKTFLDAFDFYNEHLKNELCYLHIFTVLGEDK